MRQRARQAGSVEAAWLRDAAQATALCHCTVCACGQRSRIPEDSHRQSSIGYVDVKDQDMDQDGLFD